MLKFDVIKNLWICSVLRDMVRFVQFKIRELATLLKVTFLHGCFSRFVNCKNGAESGNSSHMLSIVL